jgi:hypothetical protein
VVWSTLFGGSFFYWACLAWISDLEVLLMEKEDLIELFIILTLFVIAGNLAADFMDIGAQYV